jgi:hypothetical protein
MAIPGRDRRTVLALVPYETTKVEIETPEPSPSERVVDYTGVQSL